MFNQWRILAGRFPYEPKGPRTGLHTGGFNGVFEQDRDAMQWPSHLAIGAFSIQRAGRFQRLGVEFDNGFELRVQLANALLQVIDQPLRG